MGRDQASPSITVTRDLAQDAVLKIRSDPAWFIRTYLRSRPWQKQIEVIKAVRDNPRVYVRSCNGAGKTRLAAEVMLWFL